VNAAAPVDVYVAAGSNIDPLERLRQALGLLQQRFGELRISTAYRNRAVGFEGPDFINLVVGFRTREPVQDVLKALHEIELQCGRPRLAPKWASRTMDLDILLYGDLSCDTQELRLPRRDLLVRPYMLGPLAEIAPHTRHPIAGKTTGELWASFDPAGHTMTPVEL
jgi:2-amino-4-hydroxy-6-hydroxymethyldihydropteridine diphosphokinase